MKKTFAAALLAGAAIMPISAAQAAEKTAIVAGGCFWCIEKDFETVAGVKDVVSGYTGGEKKNPTYRSHKGHREAVKITYDSSKISYAEILDTFFKTVDPTDAGGQFCDRGYAYGTHIFTQDASEAKAAAAAKARAEKELGQAIITPISDASFWTDAEGYHQDYYKKNPVRYKYYRWNCGRDQRVEQLWGDAAYPRVAHKKEKAS
ncbi:peptide-methionine (S)-S-oxide reductase MsrA [Ahrensia sp. R2A130]|uniref:peptide-methionine (S)-S-oxide reductase MsrA n=1 Tax=Ahrensia sp. R2A130 TaxID=744979 RepID=UPI0001E0843E|nr:peptide-methionine (S)-S-oxide reductase MsrA [Ahrensia sp. R2A130]EFL88089.1 peptide-methionine (S)-S-oxide reductase [Ahrensia sp. R2A130]